MVFRTLVAAAVLTVAATGSAVADECKAKSFALCKACHSMDEGKKGVGPSLHNVVGRKSGTMDGFKYSDAMAKAGLTWDEATIDQYLADPKNFVKGNKMVFNGLKKPEQRADVIAFLKANGNCK